METEQAERKMLRLKQEEQLEEVMKLIEITKNSLKMDFQKKKQILKQHAEKWRMLKEQHKKEIEEFEKQNADQKETDGTSLGKLQDPLKPLLPFFKSQMDEFERIRYDPELAEEHFIEAYKRKKSVITEVFDEFENILWSVCSFSDKLTSISCYKKEMDPDCLIENVNTLSNELENFEKVTAEFTKYLVNTDGIHPDLYKACSDYKMRLETVMNDENVFAILMQLPEAIAERNQEDIDFYVDLAESLETELLPFLPESI